jgi:uncharacterized membrane protein YedE/YeeE
MKRGVLAFGSGFVFAAGLCLAGMTRPQKIIAFLDVSGTWDPSLALVMAGAVVVAAIAFRAAARRTGPILGGRFFVPERNARVERDLVVGAALFGVGWGLSGLCPGPAVVALASGQLGAIVFVGSMVAGMALVDPTRRLGWRAERGLKRAGRAAWSASAVDESTGSPER